MRHRLPWVTSTVAGAAVALSLLLVALPARAEIIFHQDFEDGLEPLDPSDGFHVTEGVNSCCDHSVEIVTSPVAHEGERSLFTTCVAGDPPVNGHRHRANLTTAPGGSIGGVEILPYDVDRWFGVSVFVPRESADVMAKTNIFNTHVQNWGSPECVGEPGTKTPLSVAFIGPTYRWTGPGTAEHPEPYYWRFSSNPPGQNGSDRNGVFLWVDAGGDVDRWVDFVFHIRHSYTPGAGFMEIWIDGVSVYRNEEWDMSICPIPQSCGNTYPKIGAGAAVIEVDSGDGLPIEVYYDSIRWGDERSTFETVDPAQDEEGYGPDGDADADVDGDADGDGDADSDGDADGDGDGDADGDSDGVGGEGDGGRQLADADEEAEAGEPLEGCSCRAAGRGSLPPPVAWLLALVAVARLRKERTRRRCQGATSPNTPSMSRIVGCPPRKAHATEETSTCQHSAMADHRGCAHPCSPVSPCP